MLYVAGEGNMFSTLYGVQPNERKDVHCMCMTCMYQFLFVLESSEANDNSLHCARVDWANTVWEGLQRWREGGEEGMPDQ